MEYTLDCFCGFIDLILSLLHKSNKEYSDWANFNSARATISDFQIASNLSKNERLLVSRWWVQDEALIPSDRVIKSKPFLGAIIYEKIKILRGIGGYRFRELLLVFFSPLVVQAIYSKENGFILITYCWFFAFVSRKGR